MSAGTQREKLMSKSDALKRSLKENLTELKNNSENVTKMALIGGGVMLGGYLLYRMLRSGSPHESEEIKEKFVLVESPRESYLMSGIKKTIATILLDIAKQKLLEYLESQNKKVEE